MSFTFVLSGQNILCIFKRKNEQFCLRLRLKAGTGECMDNWTWTWATLIGHMQVLVRAKYSNLLLEAGLMMESHG
jgi:hypothetical protein